MSSFDRLPDAVTERSQADALLAAVPIVFLVFPGLGSQFGGVATGLGLAALVGWLLVAYAIAVVRPRRDSSRH